ncbi:MAG: gamma-glutamyltransferase [Halieaceae bacterium]|jgi:gamma-glutamyltranspeptidase/glutathione hydrolase|nr:gamma-glutamyltransferase [Halieaceae bacterium]
MLGPYRSSRLVTALVIVLLAPLAAPKGGAVQGSPDGVVAGSTLGLIEAFNSYGHVYDKDSIEAMRPRYMGTHGVVSTGHYLATTAGMEALKAGGNAFDAGVAAAMTLKVTKMGYAGWTGVAPLILYSAAEDQVITRVGAGTSPAAATLERFLEESKTPINTALLPADVDVWLAALDRYGTIGFAEAAASALELAENGYHLYKMQRYLLLEQREGVMRFPYNQRFWHQHGSNEQRLGQLMVNKDLGRLIRLMIDAEAQALAAGGSRSDGIRAARDAFYTGEAARAVDAFFREHGGLVTYADMAAYEGKWSQPLHSSFMGYDVYATDGWSQGPRMILILNMLKEIDLKALGFNTADYIHTLSQVINLAMADSHRWVADPDTVDIPEALYSQDYARLRASLVEADRAFADMPPWGDPVAMTAVAEDSPRSFTAVRDAESAETLSRDTSSLNVMDAEGNLFVMTESDGHLSTPMIPGWGFGLGARMEQFNLDPKLANVMAPGKRPRNTNAPILVMKDGKPILGLSTPGGDQQVQSLLQVFLNVALWGLSPEHALDQPRFGSYNFPGTGSEVNQNPGRLSVEGRIPEATIEALRKLGHDVKPWGLWDYHACAPTVTYRDPETGVMIAAGDVRRETSSMAY